MQHTQMYSRQFSEPPRRFMIQIRANMNNDTIQKGALVDILFAQQKTDCLEGRDKNKYIKKIFSVFLFSASGKLI